MKHRAADTVSYLPISEKDNTPDEDELPLLVIDTIHNPEDTCIGVIDATMDNVVLLDNCNTAVSLDTPLTEAELLMKRTHDT